MNNTHVCWFWSCNTHVYSSGHAESKEIIAGIDKFQRGVVIAMESFVKLPSGLKRLVLYTW